jgi:hypothetical protein
MHFRNVVCEYPVLGLKLIIKVKLFIYRPRQAPKVTGGSGSDTSRQSAHEGAKVVCAPHRTPPPPPNAGLDQELFLVVTSVRKINNTNTYYHHHHHRHSVRPEKNGT